MLSNKSQPAMNVRASWFPRLGPRWGLASSTAWRGAGLLHVVQPVAEMLRPSPPKDAPGLDVEANCNLLAVCLSWYTLGVINRRDKPACKPM